MAITKSVNEIQMQAYGQMQHVLRKLTTDENDRYSGEGTEGHTRHQSKVKAADERHLYREKALANFVKENKTVMGNTRGLTIEQVNSLRDADIAYRAKLTAFKADLDKSFPAISL